MAQLIVFVGSTPHPLTVDKQSMKGPILTFTFHCFRVGGLPKICVPLSRVFLGGCPRLLARRSPLGEVITGNRGCQNPGSATVGK